MWFALPWVLAPLLVGADSTRPQGALWMTWDTFEADSCASVWLIKRHVDPKARFEFLPRGTRIQQGTQFDVPEAKLRRYATLSTYETILREYGVTDARAVAIGRIIHDIEINRWARQSTSESIAVERQIRKIVAAAKNHEEILMQTLEFFDRLAAGVKMSSKPRSK